MLLHTKINLKGEVIEQHTEDDGIDHTQEIARVLARIIMDMEEREKCQNVLNI